MNRRDLMTAIILIPVLPDVVLQAVTEAEVPELAIDMVFPVGAFSENPAVILYHIAQDICPENMELDHEAFKELIEYCKAPVTAELNDDTIIFDAIQDLCNDANCLIVVDQKEMYPLWGDSLITDPLKQGGQC